MCSQDSQMIQENQTATVKRKFVNAYVTPRLSDMENVLLSFQKPISGFYSSNAARSVYRSSILCCCKTNNIAYVVALIFCSIKILLFYRHIGLRKRYHTILEMSWKKTKTNYMITYQLTEVSVSIMSLFSYMVQSFAYFAQPTSLKHDVPELILHT